MYKQDMHFHMEGHNSLDIDSITNVHSLAVKIEILTRNLYSAQEKC